MDNYILKLIKQGIKSSDQYFKEIKEEYGRLYKKADNFEEFLAYESYSPINAKMAAYETLMTDIVGNGLNDIRFNRPAQKALFKTVVDKRTATLVQNVNEDTRTSIRNIIQDAYKQGDLSHKTVMEQISKTCDNINHTRARTIARTELNNATTTADYIINKERGANAYKYYCGEDPCEICEEDCGEVFEIDDIEHLPPRHPNCKCGVNFFIDPNLNED